MGKWEEVETTGIRALKISHDDFFGPDGEVPSETGLIKTTADDAAVSEESLKPKTSHAVEEPAKKSATPGEPLKSGSSVKPAKTGSPVKPGKSGAPVKTAIKPADSAPVKPSVEDNAQKVKTEGSSTIEKNNQPETRKKLSQRQKKNRRKRRRWLRESARKARKQKKQKTMGLDQELDLSAWDKLNIDDRLMMGIRRLGFERPTPIQNLMIPKANEGIDIFGAAETGSGKTMAFCLPVLQKLINTPRTEEPKGPRAIMLAPTRELALQIHRQLKVVTEFCNIKMGTLVGGLAVQKQQRVLSYKPEIVVVTPGRLHQFISKDHEYLSNFEELQFLVLDEADRLVTQGTSETILEDILRRVRVAWEAHELPTAEEFMASDSESEEESEKKVWERQTFVTSATLTLNFKGIEKMAAEQLRRLTKWIPFRDEGIVIDLSSDLIVPLTLTQYCQYVKEHGKGGFLIYFIKTTNVRTIVFVNAISKVKKLTSILRRLTDNVWPLHAKMTQKARLRSLDRLKACPSGVLISTDVMGRGIDVKGVELIIHFDLPTAQNYIHRVGRTARAGDEGTSVALCGPDDRMKIREICKVLKVHNLQKPIIDQRLQVLSHNTFRVANRVNFLLKEREERKRRKNWKQKMGKAAGAGSSTEESEDEQQGEFVYAKDDELSELTEELKDLKHQIRLGR